MIMPGHICFLSRFEFRRSGNDCYRAIQHGHRNSEFSHEQWWIFPLFCERLPEGTAAKMTGFATAWTFLLAGSEVPES